MVQKYYFRLDCAYHGLLFDGYAIQAGKLRTVQAELQLLLKHLFQQPINLVASGRTDKGVHALHQVCSFAVELDWIPDVVKLKRFLTQKSPKDLQILDLSLTDSNFHARFKTKSKTYLYLIRQKFDITQVHLSHLVIKPIDFDKLVKIGQVFVGTHDFLSFSTSEKANTVRTINFIKVNHDHNLIAIEINANGFLRSMVRMLVGTMIAYASNKINFEQIINAINHPQKGGLGLKAPACGLYLKHIYY